MAPPVQEEAARPPEPQPAAGKPSLRERLAALEQRHQAGAPAPAPEPEPGAPPPTDTEALENLRTAFPEGEVIETIPGNG